MFEITPDDISRLDEVQLRAAVALLCEAELRRRGYSPAAVTWGGDQNASDGGLDVRVALAAGTEIAGFIPRAVTGFQVKRQDMPRRSIAAEMSPEGILRPSIAELAKAGGAYVIVSSEGSTADSALIRRKKAMADSVQGIAHASALALDFYDRTRVASWVRNNPSLILWVRRAIGRAIQAWEPYSAWAYASEGLEAEYLVDQGVTICPRPATSAEGLSTLDGIAAIRESLRSPRSVVRLIGLSGVGKTRLAQALFDGRVGSDELDPSLAFYTNMNNGPDPQPISLASDLVATGTRAILVVDNCAAELHGRLSEVVKRPSSLLSVLTVEYDIRDDQPEGTDVYEIQVASVALIETLLRKRFPQISQVDAHTAADFSGGNARIAIALSETVAKGGTLECLSNDELFQRLFVQRHVHDKQLLEIAQACSLVYSFDGEDLTEGDSGELTKIGKMIGVSADQVYRATAELLRRDLAQRRGTWRAVLPHAVANRLAIGALQSIPRTRIEDSLVNGASKRLVKSFSRRLGQLHTSKEAQSVVSDWFSPEGWLSDVWNLSEFGRAIFENVLPVDPAAGLGAIERSVPDHDADHPITVGSYMSRALRSIAYDAALFERATNLLRQIATEGDASCAKSAREVYTSLFTLYLSGTHASVDQRVAVAGNLINSTSAADQVLGFAALDGMLKSMHFSSDYDFQFGARSRDYGFLPRTYDEVAHWYRTALAQAAKIACLNVPGAERAKGILASNFRGLWSRVRLRDELGTLALQLVAEGAFWRDGWQAVKQTRHFDEKDKTSDNYARLSELEARLRPVDLVHQVRGRALGSRSGDYDLHEVDLASPDAFRTATERIQDEVEALGEEVARCPDTFRELLPEIVSGPGNLWYLGVGLAKGAQDLKAIWKELSDQFGLTDEAKRDVRIFCGMLFQTKISDPKQANALLDEALETEPLASYFPIIQSSVGIDQKGVDRLMRSLELDRASVPSYSHLSMGRATDHMTGVSLAKFVMALACKPGGEGIALQILHMQYFSDNQDRRPHTPELIAAGRELLTKLDLASGAARDDYTLGGIIQACLSGDDGYAIAQQICENLLAAFEARKTYGFEHSELIKGLFKNQPFAALDTFFGGTEKSARSAMSIVQSASNHQRDLINQVPEPAILEWVNRNPIPRYPAIATVIDAFSVNNNTNNWSVIATTLVHSAPDPVAVMRELVARFRPDSWNGSRASILESRAKLLDVFDTRGNETLVAFVAEQKSQLLAEARTDREWENKRDRGRDEAFE